MKNLKTMMAVILSFTCLFLFTFNVHSQLAYKNGQSNIERNIVKPQIPNQSKDVVFFDDFEDGDISNWTQYDVDGDTYGWFTFETETLGWVATSASWDGVALSPENWLVSPAIDLSSATGSVDLDYVVYAQDPDWAQEHYKILVSATDNQISSFTSNVQEETLPGNDIYERNVSLDAFAGEVIYIAFVHYESTDWFRINIDDVTVTTDGGGGDEFGAIQGYVTDATTGDPIEGASVMIAGLSTTSDSYGFYSVTDVPYGALTADFTSSVTSGSVPLTVQFTDASSESSQTLTVSFTGYVDYVNHHVIINSPNTIYVDVALSPTLTTGALRFVLNWDDDPNDLDSHLKTPEIEGSFHHVFYGNLGSYETAPYAALDVDDTDGYGPETVTIVELYEGTYYFYIHKWAGSENITQSNGVVQVYDEAGLLQTLYVPTSGEGDYWHVANVDGATGSLNIINQIVAEAPGPDVKNEMPSKFIGGKDIVSWMWNFGDAGSSTEQNPTYTYEYQGTYTVSLTVSDGTNSDTKTAVIDAMPTNLENINVESLVLYPNPGTGKFRFDLESMNVSDLTVEVMSLNGQVIMNQKFNRTNGAEGILDLSGIVKGIYMVRLSTDNITKTCKLMLQ